MSADPRRTMRTRAIRASSAPVLPSSLSPVTELTMGQSSAPLPHSEGSSNDRRSSRRSRDSNAVRLLVPVLEYRDRFTDTLPVVVESPGTPFTSSPSPSLSRPALQANRQRRHTEPSPASWMPSSRADEAGAGRERARTGQGRRGSGSSGSTAEEGQKRSMVKRFVRWLVVDDKRPAPAQQPWTGYASLFG
uniref:BY PROTMAP: gi/342319764/gb/EGU11711.1/ Zinc finger CCCH domain-containing protein 18 [Rhodotorula glutinis ATCC 204091] n=1 Tax=Rhodotorula toruloides TaxID=5286 RepID=A0A0K3CFH4_RHOTO